METKSAIVTTVSGNKVLKKNCRFINGSYHEINKDCFLINEKYYRVDSGLIVKIHNTNNWVLKNDSNIIYGVVSILESNKPEYGYFYQDPVNNVPVTMMNGENWTAISEEIFKETSFVENISTGYFLDGNSLSAKELVSIGKIKQLPNNFGNLGYNIEDNTRDYEEKISIHQNISFKDSELKEIKKYSGFIENTSFGVEVEYSEGMYSEKVRNLCGLVLCRDGSTASGGEAVSIPLTCEKGIKILHLIGAESAKRVRTNNSCSYHLHLGNCIKSTKHLVALYRLGELVQEEMFCLFPFYKTCFKNFKRQDYNKKLMGLFPIAKEETISENYVLKAHGSIFSFLSGGKLSASDVDKNIPHPYERKWERKSRYYWMNLMNMYFSKRRTVEFRLHHNTVNKFKIINWLYICHALVKYAEKNSDAILKSSKLIHLDTVLSVYSENNPGNTDALFLSDYLKAYVKERKMFFLKLFKNQDYAANEDTKKDADYTFYLNNKCLF